MIALAVLFAFMFLMKSSLLSPLTNPDQSTSIALGFILIFAYLFGRETARLRLPQITGFILTGILCGPYLLRFLEVEQVSELHLIDGLALSLIALTAGGEMQVRRLKGRLKSISSIVAAQTVLIIGGYVVFSISGRGLFSFFGGQTLLQSAAVGLLLGILATATSPSSTIAVITETKSKGEYTDLILTVAVVKDFVIIVLFAVSLSITRPFFYPDQGFDTGLLTGIFLELGGSLLIGFAVGWGIIFYIKYIGREITVFILSVAFFTYQISHSYGYHPLLICLLAGFLVENFSTQGEKLILAIEKSSLPVFVIFFAISGASIDLDALRVSWLLALVCVLLRGVLKFFGTYLGASLANDGATVKKHCWRGFISQAGVALGIAVIVERTYPDLKGEFVSLVLAVIAINQIIGPVLLQKLLIKVNEAGKKKLV